MRQILLAIAVIFLPFCAMAQGIVELSQQVDDDKGFLTRLLEENLSGSDRKVNIVGFDGALSSRATFDLLTISDGDGIWLSIENGAIKWQRRALLSGKILIEELSAERIALPRVPTPEEGDDRKGRALPGFKLPELPVAIKIDNITAARVDLGQPVIGIAASVKVSGSMSLANGEGDTDLKISRLDGPEGRFSLQGQYSNTSEHLKIYLDLSEAPNGILANLLDLPDKPSVEATITGDGPLKDFMADLQLSTDGTPRVTGKIGTVGETRDGTEGTAFRVDIQGDISPLLDDRTAAFFGKDAVVRARGWLGQDGQLAVPELTVNTDALEIGGAASLGTGGVPQSAHLSVLLGRDAGATRLPAQLPFSKLVVDGGQLTLTYDVQEGDEWSIDGQVSRVRGNGLLAQQLFLNGGGRILVAGSEVEAADGQITFRAEGLTATDADMGQALGEQITGELDFAWSPGQDLRLRKLRILGDDYSLDGIAKIGGAGEDLSVYGKVRAEYADLSRLSGLAKSPLSGAARAVIDGSYHLGTGDFDARAELTAQDVSIGRPQIDGMLKGHSTISIDAERSGEIITLRDLTVSATGLSGTANGDIRPDGGKISANFKMTDLSDLDPAYSGSAQISATLSGEADNRRLVIDGHSTDPTFGIPAAEAFLPGKTKLDVVAQQSSGEWTVEELRLQNPQVSVEGEGDLTPGHIDAALTFEVKELADADMGLAGGLKGQARLVEQAAGRRKFTVSANGRDLAVGQGEVDTALAGNTTLQIEGSEFDGLITLDTASLEGTDISAQILGQYALPSAPDTLSDLRVELNLLDLGRFGPTYGGSAQLDAALSGYSEALILKVEGRAQSLKFGQPAIEPFFDGTTELMARLDQTPNGWGVREMHLKNPQITLDAMGEVRADKIDTTFDFRVDDIGRAGFGPTGGLYGQARLTQQNGGERVFSVRATGDNIGLGQATLDAALSGETRLVIDGRERDGVVTIETARLTSPRVELATQGTVGSGQTELDADINIRDLGFAGPGLGGAINANISVRDVDQTMTITGRGNATDLSFGQANADQLFRGNTRFTFDVARLSGGDIAIRKAQLSNDHLEVEASGAAGGTINMTAKLNDLAPIVHQFPGPITVSGAVTQQPSRFGLEFQIQGPGVTQTKIAGHVARDGRRVDLQITGSADAALANTVIRTRQLSGPIRFDLAMQGPPALSSLRGTIRANGVQVSDPKLGVRLQGLDLTADLNGAQIALSGQAEFAAGGSLGISGNVNVAQGTDLDIAVDLNNAHLRDPNLYDTTANGRLIIAGRLGQDAMVSGTINLGSTEIRIPASGSGAEAIPDIIHLGDRRPVRATRARAGLTPFPGPDSQNAQMLSPAATPPQVPIGLDIRLIAPNQIFVRGRGIDAELGGAITVRRPAGSAQPPVTVGQLDLIRGRIDFLGKRFTLTDGLVELQGSLIPVVRLVAEAQRDGIITRIIVSGDVRDPEVTFESSPELPEEEVLSHLLFGRGIDTISPLQAAQLANAVAVLAGRGGVGIVEKMREATGLDDLDLTTDDDGSVNFRAGKYITEKIYTDVQVGDDGKTQLNLNLDITDTLTARGATSTDGESSLGIYYERDY